MTGARLRDRRWLPVLAVAAVLAVVGCGIWLLPRTAETVPAAATTSDVPVSSSPSSVSPSSPPPTAPTVTTAAPTTPEPTTEAPAPTPEATTDPPETTQAPPPAAAPAPADTGVEGEVLALVNTERAAAGCGPVSADEGLAGIARAHSADMRDRGYFSHTTPEGLSPFDRAAAAGVAGARAENIAQGYGDASSVMAGWMASQGHRDNILNCSYTRLGTGVADGAGGPWWTQLFGS